MKIITIKSCGDCFYCRALPWNEYLFHCVYIMQDFAAGKIPEEIPEWCQLEDYHD